MCHINNLIEMPYCIHCGNSQAKLNNGAYRKGCFNNKNKGFDNLKANSGMDYTIDDTNEDDDVIRTQGNYVSLEKKLDLIFNDIKFIKSEISELKKLTAEVNTLKRLVHTQQNTIRQQQIFLERLANRDRRNNLIITGIVEK